MNWNPSSAAQIWGKYERMGANVKALYPYLPYNDRGNGDTHVNMYTFGTTWTLNSTTVLDATYGISRMNHQTHCRRLQLRQLRPRRRSGFPA